MAKRNAARSPQGGKALDLQNLEADLDSLFRSDDSGHGALRRATQFVHLFLSAHNEGVHFESLQRDVLAAVPGRSFSIIIREDAKDLRCTGSLFCQPIDRHDYVCSEIISFEVCEGELPRIPSVVRGHGFSGIVPTLVLSAKELRREIVELFLPLCGRVIFDSADLHYRVPILRLMLGGDHELVDVRWLFLANWRGEIRNTFVRSGLAPSLATLSRIEVKVSSDHGSIEPWLLAGWITSQIGLEVQAVSASGYECQRHDGRRIVLAVDEVHAAPGECIGSVRFECEGLQVQTSLCSEGFSTEVQGKVNAVFRAPRGSLSRGALLQNYIHIGESTENYRGSLERGLELLHLRQGFLSSITEW